MERSGVTRIDKAEKISTLRTLKGTHFTGAITRTNQETENIAGLTDNKIYIRGINVQSIQNLEYRLIFWTRNTFEDTDLDVDTFIDDVIIDMSDTESTFRIGSANQYYLNVSSLNILYEDEDGNNELHVSLQNLSPTDKAAGASGYIQVDFKYTPRI